MFCVSGREARLGRQRGGRDASLRTVHVTGFWIDAAEAGNAEFAEFVEAAGYVTDAERTPTADEFPGVP